MLVMYIQSKSGKVKITDTNCTIVGSDDTILFYFTVIFVTP
jgi:hypothetical protein